MMQKANGWKSYRMYSESIEPRLAGLLERPFSMTYGVEAVIPLETGFPTSRTSSFNPRDNDEQMTKSLDLIEEKREKAMVQLAYY